jgi:glycosyltransferase involved in cell wall biosynthesis
MALDVSWALLTFNRSDTVTKCVPLMYSPEMKEIVWCDNGSFEGEQYEIEVCLKQSPIPVTKVLNPTNLGVDVGYNRAIALTQHDWIVITGCDRIFPEGWLEKAINVVKADPSVKVVSIYSQPISKLRERIRGDISTIGGERVQKAMPFGARLFHRELLKKAGYFRQDFGLYGWSDIEFSERQMRVCNENGWNYVAMLDVVAQHLGDEGINAHQGNDPKEYHEFKQREVRDPAKQAKLKWCRENNYPFYSPYGGHNAK